MENKKYQISELSKHLFWDVDPAKISWENHPHFLVQRILEYGLIDDWNALRNTYGIDKIAEIATELRSLEVVSLHFISTISKTPLEKFRCYKLKQQIPHWSGYSES